MKILIICKDYVSRLQFLKSRAHLHSLCIEIAMVNIQKNFKQLDHVS